MNCSTPVLVFRYIILGHVPQWLLAHPPTHKNGSWFMGKSRRTSQLFSNDYPIYWWAPQSTGARWVIWMSQMAGSQRSGRDFVGWLLKGTSTCSFNWWMSWGNTNQWSQIFQFLKKKPEMQSALGRLLVFTFWQFLLMKWANQNMPVCQI